MSSATPVIDLVDLERCIADGFVHSISTQTFRIDRRRFLNSSSEGSNSSDSSNLSNYSIDLPKDPASVQTGLYLGFSQEMAQHLFTLWNAFETESWAREEEYGHFVINWIKERPWDRHGLGPDWTPVLQDDYGLHPDLIARIMDPTEDHVRLCETPQYWVVSLIEQRWYIFVQACEKLQKGDAPPQASGSAPSQPPTPAKAPAGQSKGTSPGFTVLYKGVYEAQARWFFPRGSSMDGPWTLGPCATQPGGDFNGESLYHYWTPQFMAAHAYARYKLKNNSNQASSVYVMQITVPNSWIESQRRLILDWPSDLYKQVVWHSRNMLPLAEGNVPQAEGFRFFIGDTATGAAQRYAKMSSWRDMTESDLMMTRPDNRVQDSDCNVRQKVRQYAFSAGIGRELEAHRPQPDIKVLHFEKKHEVVLY